MQGNQKDGERMTGLECLREEMKRRGATPNQITSKAVGMVLDIMSGGGETYINIAEAEQHLVNLTNRIAVLEGELKSIREQIRREREWNESIRNEITKYVEDFNNAISDMETAEGRDALKTAQMFVNSVDVDTKYDNTAFIIGLASILSGESMNAIAELKKMNPQLFCEKRW